MKRAILAAALAGFAGTFFTGGHGFAQNLLEQGAIAPMEVSVPAETPDASAYADGVRAINDARWSDAISVFSRIETQAGEHADGALYWKAYAENKLGQADKALEDCARLRSEHAGSKWIDECGALEIEIRGKSGQPVQPHAQQSDELRLLALATLMQHDEKRALKEIDEILNSDAPEKLKQGALFIMGEHHSDTIYPQVVRVSYVEGDVRISRGEKKKHDKNNSDWEQAAADLPLEAGYSLVTGNGRAEIELEDASTIYLAENSVLMLNDLHTVGGVPYTEVALLTGTATLHVKPYVAGEYFILHMPTDALMTRYPQVTDLRVSSYTDGIALTSLGGGTLGLNGVKAAQVVAIGQTYYFKNGKRTIDAGPIQAPDFSAWDKWVADRYKAHSAEMAEMLKASGLTTPIPGLADMAGKGKFVDCPPYGTCWEPAGSPPEPGQGEVAQVAGPETRPEQPGQTIEPQGSSGQGAKPARNIGFIGKPMPTRPPAEFAQMMWMFPCVPGGVLMPYSAAFNPPAWYWAVCHSGSWIYSGNRYMWVAGKCHHHPPVHWIRYGDRVAFVPVHPRDVKDRPPVNHKNPVFAVNPKGGRSIERVEFPTSRTIELLKEPPRGLRVPYNPPLVRAEEPRMAAYSLRDSPVAKSGAVVAKGGPVHSAPVPITFDHRSQTFMMQHQEMHGSHAVMVNAPINNQSGTLQSRAVGFGGGPTGGFQGNPGGGGARGGGAGGGGARAGGGGGSPSSGGARSGGGGSSAPVSSGGASGASSAGGANHH